jgi:hypothetical protein
VAELTSRRPGVARAGVTDSKARCGQTRVSWLAQPPSTARNYRSSARTPLSHQLLRSNNRLLGAAGTLLPAHLRSLDAIHPGSALQLQDGGGCHRTGLGPSPSRGPGHRPLALSQSQ